MNSELKNIVALEISSSKIIGAVGYAEEGGKLTVTAMAQEKILDYVRYGIIQNPEEVSLRVARILERLEASKAVSPDKIKNIFVGLSGRSLKSVISDVKFEFPEDTEITDSILEQLKRDAAKVEIEEGLEIVDVVPRSYMVDKLETVSPKGSIGKSISAVFDIVVCRPDIRRNLRRAITEKLNIGINEFIVTPLAISDLVLKEEEKRLGCMLVDFGAETTTVCIFRKGALHYFNTIPLGGRNITRDITSLSLLEERAEEIKCESGKAIPRDTPSSLNLNGFKLSDVSNLVVARAEEIVANVIEQIAYAGLKDSDLPGGVICVGAAANLNGMLELIENYSGLTARNGDLPSFITSTEPRGRRLEGLQVVSILYEGSHSDTPDCIEPAPSHNPGEEELPAYHEKHEEEHRNVRPNKMGKIFNTISRGLTNMFAPPSETDDSELD